MSGTISADFVPGKAGKLLLCNGVIETSWWGYDLGKDKEAENSTEGYPGIAPTVSAAFCVLPDIEIEVKD
ncbi:MAG: hypothetical protein MJ078_07190, partial [Clostridia bacterium]|nr:hypothetical protein [Clostridia bacterium]